MWLANNLWRSNSFTVQSTVLDTPWAWAPLDMMMIRVTWLNNFHPPVILRFTLQMTRIVGCLIKVVHWLVWLLFLQGFLYLLFLNCRYVLDSAKVCHARVKCLIETFSPDYLICHLFMGTWVSVSHDVFYSLSNSFICRNKVWLSFIVCLYGGIVIFSD